MNNDDFMRQKIKVKVKVAVYGPVIYWYACPTDINHPLTRWAPIQPANIDLVNLGYVHQVPVMAIQY